MRELTREKKVTSRGFAEWPDNIKAEHFENTLSLIGIINDDDMIEASSPKRVGKTK